MFNELKKQEAAMSEYKKASRAGASPLAKIAAYFVAIAAITILSLIFAQTTSGVFLDPTMKIVGILAALVVGGSSIVFLLFKGKLLISKAQFIAGCLFLAAEMTLLTLGAIHAFGSSLGWTFDPFVNEAAKLAVVLTFPLVAIEWIVVLALDPHESSDRADNMSRSALAKKEREARERFRISDPVMKVRNAAAMTEVINEEMLRLPTAQRGMFASILRNEYGDQFEGVQLFLTDQSLPNVIDQPQPAAQPPAPRGPIRAMFSRQQPPAQPQTMAADGSGSVTLPDYTPPAPRATSPAPSTPPDWVIEQRERLGKMSADLKQAEWDRLSPQEQQVRIARDAYHAAAAQEFGSRSSNGWGQEQSFNRDDTAALDAARANLEAAEAARDAARAAAPKG